MQQQKQLFAIRLLTWKKSPALSQTVPFLLVRYWFAAVYSLYKNLKE